MILFQAGFTGVVGFGLGVGLCGLVITLARLRMPDYAAVITFPIIALAFAMMVVIAGLSSLIAARGVLSIDPFEIFRG